MKNIINWNYERASWQWDLLCLLILMFIFFTPKEWFNNESTMATQTPAAAVQVESPPGPKDQ
ncbi:MAG TPA: hypothetical protein VNA17_11135 [Pyrinomonadaceae bacterium]|nr:hypothetical protein [Pyrinomonadaceae bacterium]